MNCSSDAGSIPARSTIYHEEGPTEGGRSPDDARRINHEEGHTEGGRSPDDARREGQLSFPFFLNPYSYKGHAV